MTRAVSLLPEACLAISSAAAFGALIAGSARAGRIANRAALLAIVIALVASLATIKTVDEWMFTSYRIDLVSQVAKATVCVGLLVATILTRRSGDQWVDARAVGPFFRLVGGIGLFVVASASDLLVLWLGVETALGALLVAAAVEGRWSTLDKLVRRILAVTLPGAVVLGLGAVVMASAAGSTRYDDLITALDVAYARTAFDAGAVLVVLSLVVRLVVLSYRLRQAYAAGRPFHSVPEIALLGGLLAGALRLMALAGSLPLP